MDIARPEFARRKRRRRIILTICSLVALAIITRGLQQLKPAAPSVEFSGLYPDTVKRGPMLRQVRGNGTLVPEEIRWIPTTSSGRVEKILVLPGAAVKADSVLVELSNPELEQQAFESVWALKAAEAQHANLKVTLESQRLNLVALVATAEANYNQAKLEAEVNESLSKDGLVPDIELKKSKARAAELFKLTEIEKEKLKISADSIKAQLAVQEATVAQLRAQHELKKRQVEQLKIRAGIDGVLQRLGDQINLQIGQQIAAGYTIARVANPSKLKAEIKIPETQARDIQLDQAATIDTRNGFVQGRVVRIDPGSQNGTRTVDVALDGPLPRGAVPELSVDGTIELERLDDVIYVGRMVNGQPDSTITVFKVLPGRKEAMRTPVKLGRSSVSSIEIIQGLQPGEEVILSDMSAWDAYERLRLR